MFDADATGNNRTLDVNRANAKALGLLADDALIADAEITFSSQFTWDFDPSDGLTPSTVDFVGVATHEIGHALGFVSGVDTVDVTTEPNGPYAPSYLDSYRVFSVLDLFRYSGQGVHDMSVGGTPYFSIDNGLTSIASYSTGAYNGDGRQASHWKDNLGIGIMDPTLGYAELATITETDLRAFDVIGWDRRASVPEAGSTITFVFLSIAGLWFARRARL